MNPYSVFSTLVYYFRLFSYYAGNRLYFLLILMFTTGVVESIGLGLFLPLLKIDNDSGKADSFTQLTYKFFEIIGIELTLFSLVVLIFVVFFFKGVITFLQKYLTANLIYNLIRKLKYSMASQYAEMDYKLFTNKNIGYLNNLITVEIDRFYGGFSHYCDLIVSVIHVFIFITFTSTLNLKMTIFVIFSSLLTIFSLKSISRYSAKVSVKKVQSNADVQSFLIQGLHNYKYLKATESFAIILAKLKKKLAEQAHYGTTLQVLSGILHSTLEPLAVLYLCLLIFYQVYIVKGSLSEVLILFAFFFRTFSKVFTVQTSWQKFSGSIGSISAVEKARKEFAEYVTNDGPVDAMRLSQNYDLVFDSVSFSYGNKKVLHDISIRVPQFSSIGIVGESGAGKTTLFDLVTGLLLPESGRIFLGDVPFSQLNKASLRSMLGYVTQEPVIFDDTVANNITLWRHDKDDQISIEKMKKVAHLAHCADFISDLEKGYDSYIGDKGIKLSGGQRQRIAIARELYKDPKIMIYDEATSALDTRSEQLVQKSISEMKGSHTVIIIAHRLSTIRQCDYLYVLDKGHIIEEGTFEELCRKKGGQFSQMCLAQQL